MDDIVERLNLACNGHPAAKVAWPHRLLHDAISEIERLRAALDVLKELVELEFGEGTDGQPLTHQLDTAGYYELEHRMRAAVRSAE